MISGSWLVAPGSCLKANGHERRARPGNRFLIPGRDMFDVGGGGFGRRLVTPAPPPTHPPTPFPTLLAYIYTPSTHHIGLSTDIHRFPHHVISHIWIAYGS